MAEAHKEAQDFTLRLRRYARFVLASRAATEPQLADPGLAPRQSLTATLGRKRAIAQVKDMRLSGFTAWLAWLVVHIWYLIGFRNRLAVLFNWAWSFFTLRRNAQLITGEDVERLPEIAYSPEMRKSHPGHPPVVP